MAHAWKACWVNALGGSNPPFSASSRTPTGNSGRFCVHHGKRVGLPHTTHPEFESPILHQQHNAHRKQWAFLRSPREACRVTAHHPSGVRIPHSPPAAERPPETVGVPPLTTGSVSGYRTPPIRSSNPPFSASSRTPTGNSGRSSAHHGKRVGLPHTTHPEFESPILHQQHNAHRKQWAFLRSPREACRVTAHHPSGVRIPHSPPAAQPPTGNSGRFCAHHGRHCGTIRGWRETCATAERCLRRTARRPPAHRLRRQKKARCRSTSSALR
jgi:hypothetical protein